MCLMSLRELMGTHLEEPKTTMPNISLAVQSAAVGSGKTHNFSQLISDRISDIQDILYIPLCLCMGAC